MEHSRNQLQTVFSFTKSPLAALLLTLVVVALLSCARSSNPNVERGSNYRFQEGFPEVRISAIGLIDESGKPGINVAADIVYGSLVFKSQADTFKANLAVDIQIYQKGDKSKNVARNKRFVFTVTDTNQSIVNSQEVLTFERRIEIEPGQYEVNVSVTDQSSGKQTTRTTSAYLPDPRSDESNLTNIRMLGKEIDEKNNKFIPITTYDVPGRIDSLQFVFQVTNYNPGKNLTVETELMKFKSDTTPARPMSFNNYSPSTIQYKGIDLDEETTIQTYRRVLTETGNILIEYQFPILDRGNYRFRSTITDSAGNELTYKARDFSVKSKNYPAIKTPLELARPLYYLMSKKEYEKLMSHRGNPDSLKSAIDRFWLKNVGDPNTAKSVISMYYERVEEANKQFSNFKEGWKTDPGMIYILFGPPWYVEQSLDLMRWSYSYNREDPLYNYLFRKPKMRSEFYPFEHYILQRQQYYYNIEYQQIQRWLSGTILTRSI